MLETNRFTIKFNDPFEKDILAVEGMSPQGILEQQAQAYKNLIIVDRRLSVIDLKIKIVSFFDDFPLNQLVFRRGGAHGTELVEDDLSLK